MWTKAWSSIVLATAVQRCCVILSQCLLCGCRQSHMKACRFSLCEQGRLRIRRDQTELLGSLSDSRVLKTRMTCANCMRVDFVTRSQVCTLTDEDVAVLLSWHSKPSTCAPICDGLISQRFESRGVVLFGPRPILHFQHNVIETHIDCSLES